MNEILHPEKISSYFKSQWKELLFVTISGLIYNIGLLAGPLFEGQLAQCLLDIFNGTKFFTDMAILAAWYVAVITVVQAARYLKRLYVRKFANHINRSMKQILYGNLVHMSRVQLHSENTGSVITKAISDVDACAEGMRKFTTEVFDTGVALLDYIGLLLFLDWKLALLCLIFPPFAYLIAEKMKAVVQSSSAAAKESASRLNAATLDRVGNAVTYRIFGCEQQRNGDYEVHLKDYEKKAVSANIWVAALPPLYHVISMVSVLFILYFGPENVVSGQWNIAAFTTFLACFAKLSVKSSKAAKLFNSVQKAEVSWKRIQPLMHPLPEEKEMIKAESQILQVTNLAAEPVFSGLSFTARPGQIIGVTGPVACGKSTLGRTFLCEEAYSGSIRFGGKELADIPEETRCGIVGYLGHDPELMSDSLRENILLGEADDVWKYLRMVKLDQEVTQMPEQEDSRIGSGGILLSGGQQQRVALARALAHPRPLLILDDPFSALDRNTERELFKNLREAAKGSIVILISHRLYLFPEMDGVIWMENGTARVSNHEELLQTSSLYAQLYEIQQTGGDQA